MIVYIKQRIGQSFDFNLLENVLAMMDFRGDARIFFTGKRWD